MQDVEAEHVMNVLRRVRHLVHLTIEFDCLCFDEWTTLGQQLGQPAFKIPRVQTLALMIGVQTVAANIIKGVAEAFPHLSYLELGCAGPGDWDAVIASEKEGSIELDSLNTLNLDVTLFLQAHRYEISPLSLFTCSTLSSVTDITIHSPDCLVSSNEHRHILPNVTTVLFWYYIEFDEFVFGTLIPECLPGLKSFDITDWNMEEAPEVEEIIALIPPQLEELEICRSADDVRHLGRLTSVQMRHLLANKALKQLKIKVNSSKLDDMAAEAYCSACSMLRSVLAQCGVEISV